ncbi:hypothetical protein [Lactobacillus delbrueckii]
MFDQIEEFMEKLLEKLPEDEQTKVDHQIYYNTGKNSLRLMLEVNGTSPHFWMYYAESGWGAVECWIKKDGTMEGAIFHDAGRLTKLREGVDCYYVVNTADDGSDAFAVKFDSLEGAEKYLNTEENNFRERELLTENEFWATWSKPADAYASEEDANQDGYVWDDDFERWLEIPIKNA